MIKRNPNLRKLSIAYGQGKIDLTEYRKLRTFQLSALDFSKPQPDLPPQFDGIDIPSINIDPPNKPSSNRSYMRLLKTLIIIVVVSAAGGAAYYHFMMGGTPANKQSSASQKKAPLTLELRANKMINKRVWTNRDINQFKAHWVQSSSAKRDAARGMPWFAELEATIKERIDETKDLIDAEDDSEADETLLNNLRLFYAHLKTE